MASEWLFNGSRRRIRRFKWGQICGFSGECGAHSGARRPTSVVQFLLGAGICSLALFYLMICNRAGGDSAEWQPRDATKLTFTGSVTSRRLMAAGAADSNASFYNHKCERVANSTKGHLSWESCEFEKSTGLTVAWVVLYILGTLVIFVALAIVCDDFFVPSLEAISEKLHLSEDVAGATFMAAGSSAPELFSSIAAVSFDSDAGIGTIAGSAVFNLLVIISLTAAFAGKVLHLDWRPLARDSFFYLISILFFIYMVWDSVVQLWEAAVLLVLYGLYILTMVFNSRLMDLLAAAEDAAARCCSISTSDNGHEEELNGIAERRQSTHSNVSVRSEEMMKVFRHDRRNSVVLHIAGAKPAQMPPQQILYQKSANSQHHLMPLQGSPPNRKCNGCATESLEQDKEILPEENDETRDPPQEARSSGRSASRRPRGDSRVEFSEPPGRLIHVHVTAPEDEAPTGAEDSMEGVANREEDGLDGLVKTEGNSEAPVAANDEAECDGKGDEGEDDEEQEAKMRCCCAPCPDIRGAPPKRSKGKEGRTSGAGLLLLTVKWVLFVVAFPFLCLFSWTIPDCSREDLKKYFMVSFLVSVFWIAGLSFAMVTIVARMGCLLGIDTFVMSLVVLAAGTSIPDLLSSIIVARDGFGDMAVSNAIGSNVFDIDLGLGLPFLIRACINWGRPLDMFSDEERRTYCENRMKLIPHVKFGVILIILLAICMAVIAVSKFRLGRLIGVSFFLLYIGFLVYAFCQEFLCSFDC